jgi:hypothetical protein
MATSNADARAQLLDAIAEAADDLAFAIAAVGEAYDRLEESTADRLEEALFRPLQTAYGRTQRTHAEFAGRHGLPARRFEPGHAAVASHGAQRPIDDAVEAVRQADARLSELQDSMLPIEFGDPELRAGLSEVRTLLDTIPARAREFVRTLGR